jgi:hypothetical protein
MSAPPVVTRVFRRLRETGPGLLVPLAWTFVTAAHLELVATRTVLIAHVVMTVLLAAFALLSYGDMREGVLRAWLWVIVVGFGVTLVGTASFLVPGPTAAMQTATVVGWLVVPGVALVYTGRAVETTGATRLYLAAGGLSLAGAVVYLAGSLVPVGLLVGLTLGNVGQTAGILHAVVRY